MQMVYAAASTSVHFQATVYQESSICNLKFHFTRMYRYPPLYAPHKLPVTLELQGLVQ